MKIKFSWDDDLPLNKTLKLHDSIIVVRPILNDNNKYYPQVLLDDCFYKLAEYDRIDVTESIYANKIGGWQECINCHYWYLLLSFAGLILDFNRNYGVVAIIWLKHLSASMILRSRWIIENDYRIHFQHITKSKAKE